MRKRNTFDYGRFFRNFFLMGVFWFCIVAVFLFFYNKTEILRYEEEKSAAVYFGFKDNEYSEAEEGKFLHAINMEELQIQPETEKAQIAETKINITKDDLKKLNDLSYLKNNFYIVDKRTDLLADDIKPEEFLAMDFKVDMKEKGPKILIFHTHSQEKFADSKDTSQGVWGAGEYLKELLEKNYGVEVLHHNGVYDVVDGKSQILGAYERMEPDIRRILRENPSIEVVIDMHRDGVREDVHFVQEINGKQCAKVMFFNGLCRVYDNGELKEIDSLKNTYLNENLGLSFNLQLTANAAYPGFTRKVYINAYRYSLHMKPKSIVIEVGAQTNTYEEALNAMEPLSEILANVIIAE